jgi:hypothetical protein
MKGSIMSSVDELVRTSILAYPTLYSNRTEVLHFVLCVIGNGYEWVDGKPVRIMPEPRDSEVWTREIHKARFAGRFDNQGYDDFVLELMHEHDEKLADKYEAIVNDIDARIHLRVPMNGIEENAKERFYPQSNHALLTSIPSDVTAEWAEACDEMRVEAAASGWVF